MSSGVARRLGLDRARDTVAQFRIVVLEIIVAAVVPLLRLAIIWVSGTLTGSRGVVGNARGGAKEALKVKVCAEGGLPLGASPHQGPNAGIFFLSHMI
jgi:hypothetical protein